MDVIYRLGVASAADIHVALPDAPTYTSVRGLLRVMVRKRLVRYEREGRRYVYMPSTPKPSAGATSIQHVVKTFFAGSPADAMAALLGSERVSMSDEELDRLGKIVTRARGRRRRGGK